MSDDSNLAACFFVQIYFWIGCYVGALPKRLVEERSAITFLSHLIYEFCGRKKKFPQTYFFFGLWSIAVGPNKSEVFVPLSWSIDIWAKINDVMLSQTVSSCVTGSPPSQHITKEQLGRNHQWRSQTPTFTPIHTLNWAPTAVSRPMRNSLERSKDFHRIGTLIIYNILNISFEFACYLHVCLINILADLIMLSTTNTSLILSEPLK